MIIYGHDDATYDYLYGSAEDDIIYGLGGGDSIFGLEGNDTIYGGKGSDNLTGNEGDDLLIGGASPDNLYGSQGNDTLIGNRDSTLYSEYAGFGFNTFIIRGVPIDNGAGPFFTVDDDIEGFEPLADRIIMRLDPGSTVVPTLNARNHTDLKVFDSTGMLIAVSFL